MSEAQGRLLLIGWEMADWKVLHPLVDRGELPTLQKLLDDGVSGDLYSPTPSVPAAQWTSVATGKRAWQHQVCVAFEGSGSSLAPVGADSRASCAIWDILEEEGHRSLVLGWPATHGGDFPGLSVSDRFHYPTAPPGHPWPTAAPGTYHPPDLAFRLDDLRVSPEEITPEAVAHYVPQWQQFDQSRDPILSKLRIALAADFSYQAAATDLLESEPWSFAAVRFPGIGEICRLFARHWLLADNPAAKPEAMFRDVLPKALQTMDAMLGRLLEVAGPTTAVMLVSPNGVSASLNLDANSWKSGGGIFLASGPGFKQDALVHGVSGLDVTPTILNWFRLPGGADMEGRPRVECLREFHKLPPCNSWDCSSRQDSPATPQLRQTLSPGDGWQYDWNRSQSLLEAGHVEAALPLLEALFRDNPENPTYSQTLFQTQLSQGQIDEAEETLEVLLDSLPPELAPLPQAELALARGERESARQLVNKLLEHPPRSSPVWYRIGLMLLALREWNKLEACARAILQQTEDNEIAWLGLAEASLRRQDYDTAAEAAQRAIGLQFYLPDAHLALARALAGKGNYLAGIQATERLLQIDPTNKVAQNYLRRLSGSLNS